ncbi:sel-1 homolog 3-like [Pelobates cultripes]|uniref:Sel-1 homolog 3-like n=1 Tax=Pelobates cultripes TaxID=61616 RepID=A0AAD1R903_PELCU|nr:sel-1 homolog 3-like [Pelobates cultripes]
MLLDHPTVYAHKYLCPSLMLCSSSFPANVLLDDTVGRLYLGGSPYVQGMSGFFGPSVYHRNRLKPVYKATPPRLIEDLHLPQWHQVCHEFHQECTSKFQRFLSLSRSEQSTGACSDIYNEYVARTPVGSKGVRKRGGESPDFGWLGKALYTLYMRKVSAPDGLSRIRGSMNLLLQAGCLGYYPALHLASTLYQTGFGMRIDTAKALKLKLLSAQKDERLSQMSLGHKHHFGVDNYPVDYDVSYAYYSNVALQTITDRMQPSKDQAFVEFIRLIDEDVLKHQTKEDDDLFMWLRFQAKQGVASAQVQNDFCFSL